MTGAQVAFLVVAVIACIGTLVLVVDQLITNASIRRECACPPADEIGGVAHG